MTHLGPKNRDKRPGKAARDADHTIPVIPWQGKAPGDPQVRLTPFASEECRFPVSLLHLADRWKPHTPPGSPTAPDPNLPTAAQPEAYCGNDRGIPITFARFLRLP